MTDTTPPPPLLLGPDDLERMESEHRPVECTRPFGGVWWLCTCGHDWPCFPAQATASLKAAWAERDAAEGREMADATSFRAHIAAVERERDELEQWKRDWIGRCSEEVQRADAARAEAAQWQREALEQANLVGELNAEGVRLREALEACGLEAAELQGLLEQARQEVQNAMGIVAARARREAALLRVYEAAYRWEHTPVMDDAAWMATEDSLGHAVAAAAELLGEPASAAKPDREAALREALAAVGEQSKPLCKVGEPVHGPMCDCLGVAVRRLLGEPGGVGEG